MIEERKIKRILVVNMNDVKSREFLASLRPEDYLDYQEIVDWYNPAHYERVVYYLHDLHYPSLSTFPSVWITLPREYTFAKEDQVALISGFSTHQQVIDETSWAMCDAIIEATCMSESYKLERLLTGIALKEGISIEALTLLSNAKTVEMFRIFYYQLVRQGRLQVNTEYEKSIQLSQT